MTLRLDSTDIASGQPAACPTHSIDPAALISTGTNLRRQRASAHSHAKAAAPGQELEGLAEDISRIIELELLRHDLAVGVPQRERAGARRQRLQRARAASPDACWCTA